MTTSTQCQHGALQSGCVRCKDARIAELETEVNLRGEAISIFHKALANDSQIVAQWQANHVTEQAQIKALREALIKIGNLFTFDPKMHLRPNDPSYRMTNADSDRVDAAFIAAEAALASTEPEQKEGGVSMASLFNADQQSYMRSLDAIPLAEKCWCGWYRLKECTNCKSGRTRADKVAEQCPECHNDGGPDRKPITHRIGCKHGGSK